MSPSDTDFARAHGAGQGMPPRVRLIIAEVAASRGLTFDDLVSDSRVRKLAAARRVAYARLADLADPVTIAAWMRRDPSSVRKGLGRISRATSPKRPLAPVVVLSLWRGSIVCTPARPTMASIAAEISAYHGVTVADMRAPCGSRKVCDARNHAVWAMDQQDHLNRSQIGRWMGGRDRTTIDSAIRTHEARSGNVRAA